MVMKNQNLPYVWDYDITESQFYEILNGKITFGRLNRDWAARRVLEYASYEDIISMIGFKHLVQNWKHWRIGMRSKSRVRGLDFLVEWLPTKHPEYLHD
jgi:hypothetical protein